MKYVILILYERLRGEMIMINVSVEDLKYKSEFGINHGQYQEGYRLVYFNQDNTYEVGIFSGTIEDFMIDFVEVEHVEDDSYIPPFVSVEDILNSFLKRLTNDVRAVAIYKTDGTLIAKKDREN